MQWDKNDSTLKLATIKEEIQQDSLFMWADSSFIKDPSVGRPKVMMPYGAELCRLTSAFFLLLWVCNKTSIKDGNVVIYCDNETAINNVFKNPLSTNNPYEHLAVDINLITCAREILVLQLPLDVQNKKEWVKGHYKGAKHLEHHLNGMTDELAITFNSKWWQPVMSNI